MTLDLPTTDSGADSGYERREYGVGTGRGDLLRERFEHQDQYETPFWARQFSADPRNQVRLDQSLTESGNPYSSQGLPIRAQAPNPFTLPSPQMSSGQEALMSGLDNPLGHIVGMSPGERESFHNGFATAPITVANWGTWGREGLISLMSEAMWGGAYQQQEGQMFGEDTEFDPTHPARNDMLGAALKGFIDGAKFVGNTLWGGQEAVVNELRRDRADHAAAQVQRILLTGGADRPVLPSPSTSVMHTAAFIDNWSSSLVDALGMSDPGGRKFSRAEIQKEAATRGVDPALILADWWDLDITVIDALMRNPRMSNEERAELVANQGWSNRALQSMLSEAALFIGMEIALVKGAGLAGGLIKTGAKGLSRQGAMTFGHTLAGGQISAGANIAAQVGARAGYATRKMLQANSIFTAAGWTTRGLEMAVKQYGGLVGNQGLIDWADRVLWEMPLSMNPGLNIIDAYTHRPMRHLRQIADRDDPRIVIGGERGPDHAFTISRRGIERPMAGRDVGTLDMRQYAALADVVERGGVVRAATLETGRSPVTIAGQVEYLPETHWIPQLVRRLESMSIEEMRTAFFRDSGYRSEWFQMAFGDTPHAGDFALTANDLRNFIIYGYAQVARDLGDIPESVRGATMRERSRDFFRADASDILRYADEDARGDANRLTQSIKGQWWELAELNDSKMAGEKGPARGPFIPAVAFESMVHWISASKRLEQAYRAGKDVDNHVVGYAETVVIPFVYDMRRHIQRQYQEGDVIPKAEVERLRQRGGWVERVEAQLKRDREWTYRQFMALLDRILRDGGHDPAAPPPRPPVGGGGVTPRSSAALAQQPGVAPGPPQQVRPRSSVAGGTRPDGDGTISRDPMDEIAVEHDPQTGATLNEPRTVEAQAGAYSHELGILAEDVMLLEGVLEQGTPIGPMPAGLTYRMARVWGMSPDRIRQMTPDEQWGRAVEWYEGELRSIQGVVDRIRDPMRGMERSMRTRIDAGEDLQTGKTIEAGGDEGLLARAVESSRRIVAEAVNRRSARAWPEDRRYGEALRQREQAIRYPTTEAQARALEEGRPVTLRGRDYAVDPQSPYSGVVGSIEERSGPLLTWQAAQDRAIDLADRINRHLEAPARNLRLVGEFGEEQAIHAVAAGQQPYVTIIENLARAADNALLSEADRALVRSAEVHPWVKLQILKDAEWAHTPFTQNWMDDLADLDPKALAEDLAAMMPDAEGSLAQRLAAVTDEARRWRDEEVSIAEEILDIDAIYRSADTEPRPDYLDAEHRLVQHYVEPGTVFAQARQTTPEYRAYESRQTASTRAARNADGAQQDYDAAQAAVEGVEDVGDIEWRPAIDADGQEAGFFTKRADADAWAAAYREATGLAYRAVREEYTTRTGSTRVRWRVQEGEARPVERVPEAEEMPTRAAEPEAVAPEPVAEPRKMTAQEKRTWQSKRAAGDHQRTARSVALDLRERGYDPLTMTDADLTAEIARVTADYTDPAAGGGTTVHSWDAMESTSDLAWQRRMVRAAEVEQRWDDYDARPVEEPEPVRAEEPASRPDEDVFDDEGIEYESEAQVEANQRRIDVEEQEEAEFSYPLSESDQKAWDKIRPADQEAATTIAAFMREQGIDVQDVTRGKRGLQPDAYRDFTIRINEAVREAPVEVKGKWTSASSAAWRARAIRLADIRARRQAYEQGVTGRPDADLLSTDPSDPGMFGRPKQSPELREKLRRDVTRQDPHPPGTWIENTIQHGESQGHVTRAEREALHRWAEAASVEEIAEVEARVKTRVKELVDTTEYGYGPAQDVAVAEFARGLTREGGMNITDPDTGRPVDAPKGERAAPEVNTPAEGTAVPNRSPVEFSDGKYRTWEVDAEGNRIEGTEWASAIRDDATTGKRWDGSQINTVGEPVKTPVGKGWMFYDEKNVQRGFQDEARAREAHAEYLADGGAARKQQAKKNAPTPKPIEGGAPALTGQQMSVRQAHFLTEYNAAQAGTPGGRVVGMDAAGNHHSPPKPGEETMVLWEVHGKKQNRVLYGFNFGNEAWAYPTRELAEAALDRAKATGDPDAMPLVRHNTGHDPYTREFKTWETPDEAAAALREGWDRLKTEQDEIRATEDRLRTQEEARLAATEEVVEPSVAGPGRSIDGDDVQIAHSKGVNRKPIPARYRLVDLTEGSLRDSWDDGYDDAIQPRQTTDVRSSETLNNIEASPNADSLLNATFEADRGIPVVADGTMMVIVGNHRTRGVKMAYDAGNAEGYRQALAARAGDYGLTSEQVMGMERPFLVRVVDDRYATRDNARRWNEPTGGMKSADTAYTISRELDMEQMGRLNVADDTTLAKALEQEQNAPFVAGIIDGFSEGHRAQYSDGRALTSDGRNIVAKAVYARVLGSASDGARPENVAALAERIHEMSGVATTPAGRLSGAIASKVGQLADLTKLVEQGRRHPVLIAPALGRVVEILDIIHEAPTGIGEFSEAAFRRLVKKNRPDLDNEGVEALVRQTADEIGSTKVNQKVALAHQLAGNDADLFDLVWAMAGDDAPAGGRKLLADFIDRYVEVVRAEPDLLEPTMFGDMGGPAAAPSVAARINKVVDDLNAERRDADAGPMNLAAADELPYVRDPQTGTRTKDTETPTGQATAHTETPTMGTTDEAVAAKAAEFDEVTVETDARSVPVDVVRDAHTAVIESTNPIEAMYMGQVSSLMPDDPMLESVKRPQDYGLTPQEKDLYKDRLRYEKREGVAGVDIRYLPAWLWEVHRRLDDSTGFDQAKARVNDGTADWIDLYVLIAGADDYTWSGVEFTGTSTLINSGWVQPDRITYLRNLTEMLVRQVDEVAETGESITPTQARVKGTSAREMDPEFTERTGVEPDLEPERVAAADDAASGEPVINAPADQVGQRAAQVAGDMPRRRSNDVTTLNDWRPTQRRRFLEERRDRAGQRLAEANAERDRTRQAAEGPQPEVWGPEGGRPLPQRIVDLYAKYTAIAEDQAQLGAVLDDAWGTQSPPRIPTTLGELQDVIVSIDRGIPPDTPMRASEIAALREGLMAHLLLVMDEMGVPETARPVAVPETPGAARTMLSGEEPPQAAQALDETAPQPTTNESALPAVRPRSGAAVQQASPSQAGVPPGGTPPPPPPGGGRPPSGGGGGQPPRPPRGGGDGNTPQDRGAGSNGREYNAAIAELNRLLSRKVYEVPGHPLAGYAGVGYEVKPAPRRGRGGSPVLVWEMGLTDELRRMDDLVPGLAHELLTGRQETWETRTQAADDHEAAIRLANPGVLDRARGVIDTAIGPRHQRDIESQAIRRFAIDLVGADDALVARARNNPALAARLDKDLRVAQGLVKHWHREMRLHINDLTGWRKYRRLGLVAPRLLEEWAKDYLTGTGASNAKKALYKRITDGGEDKPFWSAWRRSDNRIRSYFREKGDVGGWIDRLYEGKYVRLGSEKAAGLTVGYHLFRFLQDVRWLALEVIEAPTILISREGLGAFMDARKIGKGQTPDILFSEGSAVQQMLDNWSWALAQGDPGSYMRFRENAVLSMVQRNGMRGFVDELKRLAVDDPRLRILIELSGDSIEDYLRKLDADWRLAASRGRMLPEAEMRKVLEPYRQSGVISEAQHASMVQSGRWFDIPELEQAARNAESEVHRVLLQRLDVITHEAMDDATKLIFGQVDRSNIQRMMNHPFLYWPVSYMVKATKWLADVLLDRAFGANTGGLGAVTLGIIWEQHRQSLANDPAFHQFLKDNETLLFFAQMLLPVTPGDIGVTLSPWTRMLLSQAMNPDDPYRRNIMAVGPFYSYLELFPRMAAEVAEKKGPIGAAGGVLEDVFPRMVKVKPSQESNLDLAAMRALRADDTFEQPELPDTPRFDQ